MDRQKRRSELRGDGRVERTDRVPRRDILQGAMCSGADRVRVTLVDWSIVRHWFKEKSKPVGEVNKNVLVVPGVHARMGNVTKSKVGGHYRLLKDEIFLVKGQLVERYEGEPVGNVMKPWLELRESMPEQFEHTEVMQHPRAVRDDIIIKW